MSASSPLLDETAAEGPVAISGEPIRGRGPWELAWRRLRKDRVAMISLVVIALIFLVALCAPLVAQAVGHGPNEQFRDAGALDEFGLPVGPSSRFWFGTDNLGRDIFARIAGHPKNQFRTLLPGQWAAA